MTKKIITGLGIFALIAISIFIGWYIGTNIFKTSFIAYEYNGSITSYSINRGQIVSSSSNFVENIDIDSETILNNSLKIDLNDIHNNDEAIKQIEKQVNDAGGHIICIHF